MHKVLTLVFCASLVLASLPAMATPVVLFDEGHAQQFKIGGDRPLDLSALAGIFTDNGCQVRAATEPLTATTLEGVTALVISGPFLPLGDTELSSVQEFIKRGGRLAVMLHVAPPAANLLQALDVDFSNGTLYEHQNVIGDNPQDFRVTKLTAHPLLTGLPDFAVYGAWALLATAPSTTALAQTADHAWVDLNRDRKLTDGDAVQSFTVLVAGSSGQGRFAVFGDDALFQNRFLEGNNRRLAENLARWLTGASAN